MVGSEEGLCNNPQRETSKQKNPSSSCVNLEPRFSFGEHFGYHHEKSCPVVTEHQIILQPRFSSEFAPGALRPSKYFLPNSSEKRTGLASPWMSSAFPRVRGGQKLSDAPAPSSPARRLQVSISSRSRGRCQRLQKNSFRELFRSASGRTGKRGRSVQVDGQGDDREGPGSGVRRAQRPHMRERARQWRGGDAPAEARVGDGHHAVAAREPSPEAQLSVRSEGTARSRGFLPEDRPLHGRGAGRWEARQAVVRVYTGILPPRGCGPA